MLSNLTGAFGGFMIFYVSSIDLNLTGFGSGRLFSNRFISFIVDNI
jgi:hypothetical protein